MQWLTAILAFATTMLVFGIVVTALVETIHRALGSRTIGLERMLEHFYVRVIKPYLAEPSQFPEHEFTKIMIGVRAHTSKSPSADTNATQPNRYSFQRLSSLPTENFMERLGASKFSSVAEGVDADTLKDIAQKYEMIGEESGLHFESKARLKSVIVAMFVGWIFYVHPYTLIQTYLENPEVAGKVAALADGTMARYDALVEEADKLRKEHEKGDTEKTKSSEDNKNLEDENPLTGEELDELLEELADDIEAARTEVEELSNAGAPVGWPTDAGVLWGWLYYPSVAQVEKPEAELAKAETPAKVVDPGLKTPNPKPSFKDVIWLLMGGLLIGLGAPFWARLIKQLTPVQGASKNLSNILKPENLAPKTAADEEPMTSVAYRTAVAGRKD